MPWRALEDQPQDLGDLGAAATLLENNPQIGSGNKTPQLMHMEGGIPKGKQTAQFRLKAIYKTV